MNLEVFSPQGICRHIEALAEILRARAILDLRGWRYALEQAERLSKANSSPQSSQSDTPRGRIKKECPTLRQVERALLRTSRLVPGTTCIHRALAGQRMLLRRRLRARVILGLRKGRGSLEGHAWLEVDAHPTAAHLFWSQESGYQKLHTSPSKELRFCAELANANLLARKLAPNSICS